MNGARPRSRKPPLVALLTLVALALAASGSFAHTDDGCAVERHCKACRVALASAGAAPPDVPQLAPSPEALVVLPEAPAALCAVPVDSDPSRGPPAAR